MKATRQRATRQGRTAEQLDDARTRRAEQTVDARFDGQVARDGDECDADAHREAEGLADIGEERPGLLHVWRHRGETHCKQEQYDRRDDERRREPGTVATRDAQGYDPTDDAERCRRSDHHEYDRGDAKVAAKFPVWLRIVQCLCGSPGFRHW